MPDFAVGTAFTTKDRITGAFKKMSSGANKFGKTSENAFNRASRSGSRFMDVTKGILAAGAITKGFGLVTKAIGSFITEASKIEDAVAGFTPLLKSAAKATILVEKLNQTAATTPFQFQGIADITKQLLPVMNGSIENTIKTFRMLGDTGGGNIDKLKSITRGYTKALLKGKPDMEALNMIAEAGVPIFSEMSSSMGITKAQLFEMSKQGRLTTKDLTKTFQKMTSQGGIFFKGMEIASKTFSGKMSTLKDNISLTAAAIGLELFPFLKQFVDHGIKIAQTVRAWVKVNKVLIGQKIKSFFVSVKSGVKSAIPIFKSLFKIISAMVPLIPIVVKGFIAYKAILLSIAITQKAIIAIGWIKYLWLMRAAIKKSTMMLILQNKALLLNRVSMVANKIALIAWKAAIVVAIGISRTFDLVTKLTTASFLLNKISMVASTIATIAWNSAAIIATGVTWAFGAAMAFLTSPVGLVILAVAALVTGIILLAKNWDVVKAALITGAKAVADFFKLTFFTLADVILSTYGALAKGVISVAADIGSAIGMDVSGLESTVDKITNLQKTVRSKSLFGGGTLGGESEAPNANQAKAQSGSFQADINFSNLPQGAEVKKKQKGAPFLNFNVLGVNH